MNRPITMSLPLGLFSSATISLPSTSIDTPAINGLLNRQLLDMPNVAPESNGMDEDIYWDDGSK